MEPASLAGVLAEVAQTAAETLELQDVFHRVAASVRRLIPFDHMTVVRIVEEDRAVIHATTGLCPEQDPTCSEPRPLTSWSPRLRPRPGPNPRIDDARAELDPAFPSDANLLDRGMRSGLWEPFRSRELFTGGVWLSSHQPRAFTDEHQRHLGPIAAVLGAAVQHWKIWDAERRSRERIEQLEALLEPLAASLDVREVFQRISEALQPVLPHDMLVLTELDEAARTFRVAALAGESDATVPEEPTPLSDQEVSRQLELELVRDLPSELAPDSDRNRLLLSTGMRSWLRVPVHLAGKVHGMISFFHREADRYGPGDLEVSRRIADRIALALSYHRLAEEGRIAASARERAERLEAAVETLTRQLHAQGGKLVVGVSTSWRDVLFKVGRVASSDTTVLITGESGTGKEVVVRLLHNGSSRARKPLVAINCATLPEQLLETELFGYEKGAFTGATTTKIGRLEQAAEGTLFLDEIAEMSLPVQAKLLRVLEEREFQRLGGTRTIPADVRVVAATNADFAVAIASGEFREDLYYRLNVFEIHVPPLRERPEDILPLAESFLRDLSGRIGRPVLGISKDARQRLLDYSWPGNVRELRNAIERAILLCDGGLITREHLPFDDSRYRSLRSAGNGGSLDLAAPLPVTGFDLEAVDRSLVEKALRQKKGNKSRAARLLGLTRSQLYSRLGKYRLDD